MVIEKWKNTKRDHTSSPMKSSIGEVTPDFLSNFAPNHPTVETTVTIFTKQQGENYHTIEMTKTEIVAMVNQLGNKDKMEILNKLTKELL